MNLVAENLYGLVWKVLPQTLRESISARIVSFQQRARQRVPSSKVDIYVRGEKIKKYFDESEIAKVPERDLLPDELPSYSLLTTCRNEEGSIEKWLDSVRRQSVLPRELVIVDGGSTDQTIAKIEDWIERAKGDAKFSTAVSLKVVCAGKVNIAKGRNIAVSNSSSKILLFSDVGCRLDGDWAAELLRPFFFDPHLEIAMGWYLPDLRGRVAEVVGNLIVSKLHSVDTSRFLPSTRSLGLKRSVLSTLGGFPEYLTFAAEDTLFGICAKSQFSHVAFCPEALVIWDVPSSPLALWHTVRRYAQGDAEIGECSWEHYGWVLRQGGGFLVELLLLFALQLFSGDVASIFTVILAGSLLWRAIRILGRYKWDSEFKLSTGEKFLGALHVFSSQFVGFIQGLRNRREVERCRILTFPKGIAIVFFEECPRLSESGGLNQSALLVQELIAEDKFVCGVVKGISSADDCVRHYGLELFEADGFDLEFWKTRYEGVPVDVVRM
jgi:cellulose synthase/poly-beta-1,6-N-acetylglucosamine synthase-like glycosyltransferase